jgi:hypothetical protein
MPVFIFMLTRADVTIGDAVEVYEQDVRPTDVSWVGFKDVGPGFDVLRQLAGRIRADGRTSVLEVVSIDAESELRSVRAGIEIGVDAVMGGTHATLAGPLLAAAGIDYYPFPGTIHGHPSILAGTMESIVASAVELASRPDVAGLDLLAYRFVGHAPLLVERVVEAVARPVIVAGSIDSTTRIAEVSARGAWGFTVGSAIMDGLFVPGGGIRANIEAVVQATASPMMARS